MERRDVGELEAHREVGQLSRRARRRVDPARRTEERAPAGVAWADSQGLEAIGGSAASFAATIENDRSRWTGAVKKLGVAAR